MAVSSRQDRRALGDPGSTDLRALGLTDDDVRVYLALMGRPAGTQAELSKLPTCADVGVAAALRRLTETGLVLRERGRPHRYVCAQPDVSIEIAARQVEQGLISARASVAGLMQTFGHGRADDTDHLVDVVRGSREVLTRRAIQLFVSARGEIRTLQGHVSDEQVSTDVADATRTAFTSALEQGRHVRAVYGADRVRDLSTLRACLAGDHALGAEHRLVASLPCRIFLYDDVCASITLMDAEARIEGMCIIRRSPMLDALSELFERTWAEGVSLHPERPDGVAWQDSRALIEGLNAGLSDHAIARRLGWSRSTFQRRMRVLHEEYRAANRFQLGQAIAAEAHGASAADLVTRVG